MMKKKKELSLSEIFITTENEEKIPVRIFLTNLKKGYFYLASEYNKILNKISVGKLREKTVDKLANELGEYQREMNEVKATFRAAVEYTVSQGGEKDLLADGFLSDWSQLTDEQRKEIEDRDKEKEEEFEQVQLKLNTELESIKDKAVTPTTESIQKRNEMEVQDVTPIED